MAEHEAKRDLRIALDAAGHHSGDLRREASQPPTTDRPHDNYAQSLLVGVVDRLLVGPVEEVVLHGHALEVARVNQLHQRLRSIVEGKGDVPDKALLPGLARLVQPPPGAMMNSSYFFQLMPHTW